MSSRRHGFEALLVRQNEAERGKQASRGAYWISIKDYTLIVSNLVSRKDYS